MNNIDLKVEDNSDNISSESNDHNIKSKPEEVQYDILSQIIEEKELEIHYLY